MSHPAIRIDGLWKEYVIGGAPAGRTFREMVTDSFGAPLRWLRGEAGAREEERFWALRDVSLEIGQGEVVGIIGRNGAGKSTLLKILSRITAPTRGRVEIRGRIASLLEVGTGFHPELTGRENVYLNGSILGMSRAEIRARFDEIVAFAGVEKFIDTPVKRYSSGMQVRLAFAVAAHLDPEILLIDEVLAVGDAEFQKKCLGKMDELAVQGGRTVLFVSHNMAAVNAFCSRGVLLNAGEMIADDSVPATIARYNGSLTSQNSFRSRARQSDRPWIERIHVRNPVCEFGDSLDIEITMRAPAPASAAIEIEIHNDLGSSIAYVSTAPMHGKLIGISPDAGSTVVLRLGPLYLATGSYLLYFWLIKPWVEQYDAPAEPVEFSVALSDPGATGFDFKSSYNRGSFTVGLEIENV